MVKTTYLETTIAQTGFPTRHAGRGAPVLLTHGVPGDIDTLAPVADFLAEQFHAITVSLRHAGSGPQGTRGFGTAEQMDDLHDLIRALDLGPVHLVSWSYSAHAALALAVNHPQLLRSLMVYEPGFPTYVNDADDAASIQLDMATAFGPVFEALARDDLAAALRESIDAAAGEPGWFDAQPARLRKIHERNAHMLSRLQTQSPALPLAPEDLGAINCPTSVVWGADTRICYRLVSEHAARLIPGARTIRVRQAGHLLPETDPELFAREVEHHTAWAGNVAGSDLES